jgi:L-asparaginase / beta-aspartyl-peptidase
MSDWSLVLHGGAGMLERSRIAPEQDAAIRAALHAALDAGTALLSKGRPALDAVEAAVMVLEDDPHFNAARGAVLTYEGSISLDAAIMDGNTRTAGAVAGMTSSRNPVRAARAVMEVSPHVMLSGAGADEFAAELALPIAVQDWFETRERRRQLEEMKAEGVGWYDVDLKYGTVGAVALDAAGHVAAATSTGGLTGKRWGRIGDSPLIGAGTYADDRAAAISATGAGEFFIREGVAHEICARIRHLGEAAIAAADHVMADVKSLGGSGGVIVIAPDGQAGWSFNTPGMFRGRADSRERVVAIYGDE